MNRSPLSVSNLALGAVTLDVAASGGAQAWVKVAPRGTVTTRDGRSYQFDPERLIARFSADGIDLPVDLDHAIARKTLLGERADAVGWVKELQARADGLYARVEWLASALSALAARTHRYISPTFRHDDAGAATWLHSIALVAAPALSMPAAGIVPEHIALDPARDVVQGKAGPGELVAGTLVIVRSTGR